MDSTRLASIDILEFCVTLGIACITMLWNFFLLKKSLATNVTLLLGKDANDMWVPSMALEILGKLAISWKWSIIFYKWSLDEILIYLLNNLFLSHKTSHTMSTYFLMVDVPTLNQLVMVCGTISMSQPINHNGYKFSYFYLWLNKVHTMGLKK
jgi:hypothetical protein